jgi:hypothetical protein
VKVEPWSDRVHDAKSNWKLGVGQKPTDEDKEIKGALAAGGCEEYMPAQAMRDLRERGPGR